MAEEEAGYWIVDPIGHRRHWKQQVEGTDGEVVETVFGPMTRIVAPPPEDTTWVCDICNGEIPIFAENVETGEKIPLPVPALGSYALCPTCFERNGGYAKMPLAHVCSCDACVAWAMKTMTEGEEIGRTV